MAREVNSVQISGNLGKAPEFRNVGNGMATFTLAHNRFIPRGEGQFEKQTSWFRCVAWGEMSRAVMEKLSKGDRVLVQGRLEQSTYNDNGKARSSVEIVVTGFNLLKEAQVAEVVPVVEEEDDDPPIEAPKPKTGIKAVDGKPVKLTAVPKATVTNIAD